MNNINTSINYNIKNNNKRKEEVDFLDKNRLKNLSLQEKNKFLFQKLINYNKKIIYKNIKNKKISMVKNKNRFTKNDLNNNKESSNINQTKFPFINKSENKINTIFNNKEFNKGISTISKSSKKSILKKFNKHNTFTNKYNRKNSKKEVNFKQSNEVIMFIKNSTLNKDKIFPLPKQNIEKEKKKKKIFLCFCT